MPPQPQRPAPAPAFTLIELLVSMSVLAIILLFILRIVDTTQDSYRNARTRISQFREARIAFEAITRNLSQATLNTYWDYDYGDDRNFPDPDADVPEVPRRYRRQSELHFLTGSAADLLGNPARTGHACFFQAPTGESKTYTNLENLLNARGYFVAFGSDQSYRPGFIDEDTAPYRHRFRLMEYRPPPERAEAAGSAGNSVYVNPRWYRTQLDTWSRPLAENIVAVILSPRLSAEDEPEAGGTGTGTGTGSASQAPPYVIAPRYEFDSRAVRNQGVPDTFPETRHLLPPLVQVTLIAIAELDAARLAREHGDTVPPPLRLKKTWFQRAENYAADLAEFEAQLAEAGLSFKTFSASVPIRAAKWSESMNPDA